MRVDLDPLRRRVLQGGAAAGALALARVPAFAQAGSPLYSSTRQALVIGNARYASSPLDNPVNDAKAIAGELKATGFNVVLQLDAGREVLLKAIDEYVARLTSGKAIGLFYFAGHGAQLAWRNYLIPVDAVINSQNDIAPQSVELNALLQGLAKAANPMNMVILDACRDNPFGAGTPLEQKGLSQFDAPPGSLLAYATSPGNVASDGGGANGLYTESLLQELKNPGAKIEDVFKRVRLAVRRRSNGQQIPWESTSLEEDFYFRPPKILQKLSETEAEKRFEEELAIWERIKATTDPAPLEDYLGRHPSGVFSEIAQLRLDRVLAQRGEKKIVVAYAPDNPFSRGTGSLDIRFRVGDRFGYRELDLDTGIQKRTYAVRVTEVTDTEVIFNDGLFSTDLLSNPRKQSNGDVQTQSQYYIPEYSVGKKWTTRYKLVKPDGRAHYGAYEFKVIGRETVSVPAGKFNAFHVEGNGWGEESRAQLKLAYWVTPEIGRFIARNYQRTDRSGKTTNSDRTELVSYPRR